MQGLTATPRVGLRSQNILGLLARSPTVTVGAGLEIYSPNPGVDPGVSTAIIEDISGALVVSGSSVEYDNTAKIGGTATLQLDPRIWEELTGTSLIQNYAAPGSVDPVNRRMYWGNPRTRLRPYMTLTSPDNGTAKFYQGVYIPGSPQVNLDSDQPLYSVTCYDQTALYDIPITESIGFPAGNNVISALSTIVFDPQFQIPGEAGLSVLTDTSRLNASLSSPQGWAVSSGATYLDVINELLATIGYNPFYADHLGHLAWSGYLDPRNIPDEWVFDTTAPDSIVSPAGSSWQPDVWQVPNTWLFLQNGLNFAPTEGAGQYSVVNSNIGPASVEKQMGRVIFSRHELDASSQQDLVTQGNAIVVAESAVAETFTISTTPLPIAGVRDVVGFICDRIEPNLIAADGSTPNYRHCYVQSWQLPLDGSDMSWTFGTVG